MRRNSHVRNCGQGRQETGYLEYVNQTSSLLLPEAMQKRQVAAGP